MDPGSSVSPTLVAPQRRMLGPTSGVGAGTGTGLGTTTLDVGVGAGRVGVGVDIKAGDGVGVLVARIWVGVGLGVEVEALVGVSMIGCGVGPPVGGGVAVAGEAQPIDTHTRTKKISQQRFLTFITSHKIYYFPYTIQLSLCQVTQYNTQR